MFLKKSCVRVSYHRHCKSQIFHQQPVMLNTAWRSLRHDQNFIDVSENKFIVLLQQEKSEEWVRHSLPTSVNEICGSDVRHAKNVVNSIFCQFDFLPKSFALPLRVIRTIIASGSPENQHFPQDQGSKNKNVTNNGPVGAWSNGICIPHRCWQNERRACCKETMATTVT